jgi:ATP-binding cassette subfamily B protein
MIAKSYGRNYSIQKLRALCFTNRGGTTLWNITDAAEKIGLRSLGVRVTIEQLNDVQLPCILHWRQNHYVILYKITPGCYRIADPAKGLVKLSEKEFKENWFSHRELYDGVSLLLAPMPKFYELEEDKGNNVKWVTILRYYYQYKQLFFQLIIGLGIGTLIQLAAPFFTQAIVDTGINTRNLNFVYLILIAQLIFFLGSMSINFIRSWILLHISVRINVSILTDFLVKLMKLPSVILKPKQPGM